jgi:hypothetical protein
VAPIGSEQSNLADHRAEAVLKVFRRIEAGPNPELELTRHLTEETDFRETPRLAGFLIYEGAGEEPATLATLHEFLASGGDAWAAIQGRLDEYFAAAEASSSLTPRPIRRCQALAAADAKRRCAGRPHRPPAPGARGGAARVRPDPGAHRPGYRCLEAGGQRPS